MELPDELWNLIKDYQIDYKKNHNRRLKLCHGQIFSDHRPVYYKKVTGGFSPGIGGSPTWCNFSKNNHKISINGMVLTLYAIEITPNDEYYDVRYIHLYYGWVILKNFDDGVFNQICSSFEFFPDYY